MKTITLSAGQGRRLLPMTAQAPKCMRGPQSLEIDDLGDLELARTLLPGWTMPAQELPMIEAAW